MLLDEQWVLDMDVLSVNSGLGFREQNIKGFLDIIKVWYGVNLDLLWFGSDIHCKPV